MSPVKVLFFVALAVASVLAEGPEAAPAKHDVAKKDVFAYTGYPYSYGAYAYPYAAAPAAYSAYPYSYGAYNAYPYAAAAPAAYSAYPYAYGAYNAYAYGADDGKYFPGKYPGTGFYKYGY